MRFMSFDVRCKWQLALLEWFIRDLGWPARNRAKDRLRVLLPALCMSGLFGKRKRLNSSEFRPRKQEDEALKKEAQVGRAFKK